MRLAAAIAWTLAWAAFGLPWDGSAGELSTRHILWTVTPSTKRQVLDMVLNFIFYVPLGLLLSSYGLSRAQTLAVGAMLSIGTEALQLFSQTRVPNLADVVFNTAGVAAGQFLTIRRSRSGGTMAS